MLPRNYDLSLQSRSLMLNSLVPADLSSNQFPLGELLAKRDPPGLEPLSQFQREAPLSGMALLGQPAPHTLPLSLTAAARKRALDLVLDEELRKQEVLVQVAKRRRLDDHRRALQREQFLQSHKLLTDVPSFPNSDRVQIRSSVLAPEMSHRTSPISSRVSLDLCRATSASCSHRPSETLMCTKTNGRSPISLFMACDKSNLTEYQQVARQQLQVFEAGARDVQSATKGRNRRVVLKQVGIQCRHCAHLPPAERAKGSTIYPSKLDGIYQAAQNMTNGHLSKYCKHIPKEVRNQLLSLGNRKSSAGAGREYWTNGALFLGVTENDHGLIFKDAASRKC